MAAALKTPSETPLRTPKTGNGKLRVGNPGNSGGKKGRSGPRPNAFKDFVRTEIRDDPKARLALVKAAQDSEGRNFKAAWTLASDYDDEKPAEKHTIVGPLEVRVRISHEARKATAG